jgi:hypothetical protein
MHVHNTYMQTYSKTNLAVRENAKGGTYVEGLTWITVGSATETLAVLHKGVRNRYICILFYFFCVCIYIYIYI